METKDLYEILQICADKPAQTVNPQELADEFNITLPWNIEYQDNTILYEKYFDSWICWDTPVGQSVVFIQGMPVAIRLKQYRKSDVKYFWLGENELLAAHRYILSLMPKPDKRNYSFVDHKQIILVADEIGNSRAANYGSAK